MCTSVQTYSASCDKWYALLLCSKFIRLTILLGKDPHSNIIVSTIIPAIAYLRTAYPLKLCMFFPTSFLDSFLVDSETDLTDFLKTDTIMDQMYIMQ